MPGSRSRSEEFILETVDCYNAPTFLANKQWDHIQEQHGTHSISLSQIKDAVEKPCFTAKDKNKQRRHHYFRLPHKKAMYLRVVVDCGDWGSEIMPRHVVTAWRTTEPPEKGELIDVFPKNFPV